MKNKISLLIILFLGISVGSRAQDIPIQVINSAGGGGTVASGVQMYYNIGEIVISTVGGTPLVTQGFLQPDIIGKFGLTATAMYNPSVSCVGAKDGYAIITASVSSALPTSQSTFSYSYYWDPPSLCPGNNCSSVSGLSPGTYSVMVISQYTGTLASIPMDTVLVQNIVISDNQGPCMIEVFNGITPNGDGNNDFFYIKNIEEFPKNTVEIYNRWGQQLSHIEGYDNADKKWKGTIDGGNTIAPTGTYFYVIDLGNSQPLIKGWLELLVK